MPRASVGTRLHDSFRTALYALDGEPSMNIRAALLLYFAEHADELGLSLHIFRADLELALQYRYYPPPIRHQLLALSQRVGSGDVGMSHVQPTTPVHDWHSTVASPIVASHAMADSTSPVSPFPPLPDLASEGFEF